jgi:threonine/homoserine/homoserine lactone efflux protein
VSGLGLEPLLLFIEGAIIGFLIAVPVGPAAILCVRRTISTSIVAGVVTGIGASLGDTLFGAAAAFGLTFVNDFIVRNEAWIRGIGGAVLCVMGWSYITHRPPSIGDPVAADREHPYLTTARFLSSSFFITVFNPLTVMAFGAVFASRGLSNVGSDLTAALILIAAVFVGAFAWWTSLCGIAWVARVWFTGGGLIWLNRVSGIALAGFGFAAMVSLIPINWRWFGNALGLN